MLSKLAKVPGYCIGFVRGFFYRWRVKGPKSARIFIAARIYDLVVSQLNKFTGFDRVECPCCGWTGFDFLSEDTIKFWLPGVFCPRCASHERQRMLQVYIERHDPSLGGTVGTLLHFAPEDDIRKLIRANEQLRYFSTDIDPHQILSRCAPGTGFISDVQEMGVKTDSVDVIFCLHVLEHARRDRDAIQELKRALKPGGIAYIMVPFDMTLDETVEWEVPDPDIHNHIWAYAAPDFKYRLDCFDYQEIKPDTFLSRKELRRFRVPPKEIIYRCVKSVDSEEESEASLEMSTT